MPVPPALPTDIAETRGGQDEALSGSPIDDTILEGCHSSSVDSSQVITSLAAVEALAPVTSSSARPVALVGSYAEFVERLREPSAQAAVAQLRDFVNEFPASLTRPQGARRIHDFVTTMAPRLLASKEFASNYADQNRSVMEGLEKFVVMKLYKVLFRHAAADAREDERVDQRISQRFAHGADRLLPQGVPVESRGALASTARELIKVDQYRAPRDKMACLVSVHRVVEGVTVGALQRRRRPDTDEIAFIQSVLAAVIVQATPPHFFSNLEFTTAFRHPSMLSVEDRACLRNFASALRIINGPAGMDTLGGVAGAVLAAIGGRAFGRPATEEATVPWLASAGVSLRFAESSPGELLVSEVDELLDEYHRMAAVLRTLAEPCETSRAVTIVS